MYLIQLFLFHALLDKGNIKVLRSFQQLASLDSHSSVGYGKKRWLITYWFFYIHYTSCKCIQNVSLVNVDLRAAIMIDHWRKVGMQIEELSQDHAKSLSANIRNQMLNEQYLFFFQNSCFNCWLCSTHSRSRIIKMANHPKKTVCSNGEFSKLVTIR